MMKLIKNKSKKKKTANIEPQLKKLKRDELLEMLLEQTRHVEELELRLKQAQNDLENKEIKISEAGSIAEACLKLNNIFESAQAAADQYLENIKNTAVLPNQIEKETDSE